MKTEMEIGCVEDGSHKECSVGGVWAIAQVKAEECETVEWTEVRRKNRDGVQMPGKTEVLTDEGTRRPGKTTLGDFIEAGRRTGKIAGNVRKKEVREVKDICTVTSTNRWRDRKSTRLNSSHVKRSRMPSSA